MILDRVTVTGADDSVHPGELIKLARRFPFVEFGILLSKRQEGSPRFPSARWLERLQEYHMLKTSGHLCGVWVRELCQGSNGFIKERPALQHMFQRVQLNLHAEPHDVDEGAMAAALKAWGRDEYILQLDGVNDLLLGSLWSSGLRAAGLFDKSGGAGLEPGEWPAPIGPYCGYAGGLHPERLTEQLERIALAAGTSRIWIDVETHVRSGEDRQFDLGKVEAFLAIAEHWVTR